MAAAALDRLKERALRHVTFFNIHIAYFATMGLLGGLLVWLIDGRKGMFVDSLLNAVCSLCLAGLTTRNVYDQTVGSQVVLFFLMILGNMPLLSIVPVLMRRTLLRRQVASILTDKVAAAAALSERTEDTVLTVITQSVVSYVLVVNILASILTGLYLQFSYADMFATLGIQPWWFAIFATMSAFGNVGVSLTPNGFVPFAGDFLILLLQSFLILSGNVLFPILLRGFVHLVARIHPQARMREAAGVLLAQPRKFYTHLFEPRASWILAGSVAVLTLSQWFLFLIVDFDAAYLSLYSGPARGLIGWFQAVSTRTAGLQVVDIGAMHPVLQLYYAINMYISAYPIINALRSTAELGSARYAQGAEVLQEMRDEQSPVRRDPEGSVRAMMAMLDATQPSTHGTGSYFDEHGDSIISMAQRTRTTQYQASTRRALDVSNLTLNSSRTYGLQALAPTTPKKATETQDAASTGAEVLHEQVIATLHLPADVRTFTYNTLTNDILWLTCAWIVIVWAEGSQMRSDPHPRYNNVFSALFEILSGYGTCGLSFGYPTSSVSLCGQWSTLSKLVIMGVVFCGRHRGLPPRLDAAVYTPALLGFTPEQEDSYSRAAARAETLLDAAVVGANVVANASLRILNDIRHHAPLTDIFRQGGEGGARRRSSQLRSRWAHREGSVEMQPRRDGSELRRDSSVSRREGSVELQLPLSKARASPMTAPQHDVEAPCVAVVDAASTGEIAVEVVHAGESRLDEDAKPDVPTNGTPAGAAQRRVSFSDSNRMSVTATSTPSSVGTGLADVTQ